VIIDLLQTLMGNKDDWARDKALHFNISDINGLTSSVQRNSKLGLSVLESLLAHMLKLANDLSRSIRALMAATCLVINSY
jgi:hypothetical protein